MSQTNQTSQDTPGPGQPISADVASWIRDQVVEGRWKFFSELHDIHFHHTADGEDYFFPEDQPAQQLAEEALSLLERMSTAIEASRAQIAQAMTERAYLLSGRSLICVGCGEPVVVGAPRWDEWVVCGGRAEHEWCHEEDPEQEAQDRLFTLQEAEEEAHLMARTLAGPRDGDQVMLTLADGSTREGWWLVRDHEPVLFLPMVVTRTGNVVTRSRGEAAVAMPAHVGVEVTELGEDWAPEVGPVLEDGGFSDDPQYREAQRSWIAYGETYAQLGEETR